MTVIEKPGTWPATLPHLVTEVPGPKALAQVAADQAVVSGSLPRAYPFAPVRGFGMGVEDQDGNVFLDFCAGIAVNSTGHCHPRVVDAIVQQAQRLIHYSASDFYEERYQELASALAATAPWSGPSKVLLQNSGTEAVEASIKLARYMSGRQWIVGFVGGFHGRTLGALTLTNSKAKYHAHFGPLAPGFLHVPFGSEGLDELEERIIARTIPGDEIAAFVVEPVQGEGGYVVPDKDFFPRLKQIADKYCIAIVVDEVQSGVGRTGKMWAIENFGIEPDIIATAKGLGSGMPIGAVIAKEHWMRWKPGSHGSTFGGNPVAAAAAIATLEVIRDEKLMENALARGKEAVDGLRVALKGSSIVTDIRGIGLMIGVDFTDADTAADVEVEAFKRGLLVLTCGDRGVRMSPPLVVNAEEIKTAVRIFAEAAAAVAARR
ncbi:MAG: aminotransferase class III-fold pyridoxal phosphate-dependent enzyme [Candidatus Limnocylindrus sp. ZSMar2m-chloro-G89]|nr:MAG: aminotransferase class III-fold pyridoxal phosphate-dependent enzyme [Candidatus Limnocylindrus sp. ZSMar2m-chloro-G89]